jgi:hypothetical protein
MKMADEAIRTGKTTGRRARIIDRARERVVNRSARIE